MKYVKLGRTGTDVSRICLGCMSFGKPGSDHGVFPWARDFEDAKAIFGRAVEAGINYFDTANQYQFGTSEEVTGRLIRHFALPREEIVVATKLRFDMRPGRPNGGGLSRKAIMHEIDCSLKRLGMDYVDLYQIHRPDLNTPFEETMEALNDVVKAGKALYIGASTMYAWQFQKMQNIAAAHGWSRFVTMQNQYNLMYREEEREMIPYCASEGIGLVPWSPLAGGRLAHPLGTVTARNSVDTISPMVWDRTAELDRPVIENLQKMASGRGISMAQMALAWLLSKPAVTAPIVGTTSPEHVSEAVAALDIELSAEEIASLEACYKPHPVADDHGFLMF